MGVLGIMFNWLVVGLVLWIAIRPWVAKQQLSLAERLEARHARKSKTKKPQTMRQKATKTSAKRTKVVTAKKVAKATIAATTGVRFNRNRAKGVLRRIAA